MTFDPELDPHGPLPRLPGDAWFVSEPPPLDIEQPRSPMRECLFSATVSAAVFIGWALAMWFASPKVGP